MTHKTQRIILSLVVMVSLLGLDFLPGKTTSSLTYTTATLAPVWTTGIISDMFVIPNIIVEDINQDGKTEILTCSNMFPFVLNYTLSDTYEITRYHEYIGCEKIAIADVDSDGVYEIFFATMDGRVIILKGSDFQSIGILTLPSGTNANDIKVADIDNDSAQEIVLARYDDTLVYNANTLNLEWQAIGLGGSQVAVGNIDNDPLPEVVINGGTGRILNASLKIQKWSYTGGFGNDMGIGDVDEDDRDEIAWIDMARNTYVLDGDTQTIKWQHNNIVVSYAICIFDVNKDNKSEVIIGLGNTVIGYQGTDGALLWNIPGSVSEIYLIGVGDTNNDSVNEIVWGGGWHPSKEGFSVGSWVNQIVEWTSTDLDPTLQVAAGDIDIDGDSEIVMASYGTNSETSSGTIYVYDGKTHQDEWSEVINEGSFLVHLLKVAQLDTDPALEILFAGGKDYKKHLKTIDGISHITEWDSANLGVNYFTFRALDVMNIDMDAVDEIAVGSSDRRVQVFDGASNIIEWDSGTMDGEIRDLSFGDLDGNGVIDLAVLTYESIYVIETGTWTQKLRRAVTHGDQVLIANADLQGPGELLLVYDSSSILEAWNGTTYTSLWLKIIGEADIKDLVAADLDSDASQEFILIGGYLSEHPYSSLLWIGSPGNPFFWEVQRNEHWGIINSFALANLDNDPMLESVFGSRNLIQLNDILPITKTLYQNYLSFISKPRPSRGLYGTVKMNGLNAQGTLLDLRYFDGYSWSTLATCSTAEGGSYSFTNIPSLGAGQAYYVRYQNSTPGNPYRLWTWHTRLVESFREGGEIPIGDFDIGNIFLSGPYNGETISLPYTFQWTPRYESPTDTYEFNLYDAYDGVPWFYTDPLLGFVTEYHLKSLPPDFVAGYPYIWEVWVYSLDGGYGISFLSKLVYFSNTGLATGAQAQPFQPKPIRDLENHSQK